MNIFNGRTWLQVSLVLLTIAAGAAAQVPPPQPQRQLRLELVGAETDAAFRVIAALVVGPTECLLWDAQYKMTDGRRLADRIASVCPRLKAIVISHADHDHYMGATAVVTRFPGTPVYMTPSTLADYNERSASDLEAERRRPDADAPDMLVTARRLPPEPLTVDGHRLEVMADLAGDVRKRASAALWIPSLRAVLVGDLAFRGIHPWLGDSDAASRQAWRVSLQRIADLQPAIVVPGHKADVAAPDTPDVLAFMQGYLAEFERVVQSSATPEVAVKAMRDGYPALRIPALMVAGVRNHFKK